ncbi:exodeoxyribonuclease VII large subunit [Algirhabdus cladophorae]|uniref:exodeoxyribonuclease VII large subunit n=1 Tax=Algirhabdus cladophorae TaxID=3377108 RepID=UPI003B848FCF
MDLIDEPSPGQNTPEYSVSEISGAVKKALEGAFGRVRVRGEIGRVVQARSGHLYYDVKDDRNVLNCTTWKGQAARLSVRPEEGMEVIVTGKLSAFGPQSRYNLNVDEMTVAGEGALLAMLEKRKAALKAEGLFDPARKRPIPFLPNVIGVITSPSGAVIRDILHRLRDRFPRHVLIWPVAVQGKACAPEVARAIAGFNALGPLDPIPRPDLLIVARGGGAIEDLWGFNEEAVARAAAASQIPLISAVGHETDTTLIDFVSDKRAPTPTAAAEMAVPVRMELLAWVEEQDARLKRSVLSAVRQRQQRLGDVSRGLGTPAALIQGAQQRFDQWDGRLPKALTAAVARKQLQLTERAGALKPSLLGRPIAADLRRVQDRAERLRPAMQRINQMKAQRLSDVGQRLRLEVLQRDTAQKARDLDVMLKRLQGVGVRRLRQAQDRLAGLERLRESLGPNETLARGYAIVRGDGAVVTNAKAAKAAQSLEVEFSDGRVALGEAVTTAKAKRRSSTPKPDQGSLFD